MPSGKSSASALRPLRARPGARFTCFSDGLCCTDIHALGPLTRSEARAMRALIPGSVIHHKGIDAPCMRTGADGACAQREAGLCGVHKHFGREAKPVGCRRFPYGLLSTPEGGRITTEHRCPCRTLGERPLLDVSEAERSLLSAAGRLEADNRAPARIPVSAHRFVSFARYRTAESAMIERLLAGERAEDVIAAKALPDLHEGEWLYLISELYEMIDDTAGGVAIGWYADALFHLSEDEVGPARPRPWAPAFERALARSPLRETPDQIIADWLADELWMMRWLGWDCTFDVARAELATRLAMVRHIIDLLKRRRVNSSQAAAEAIMIVELGATFDPWTDLVGMIANAPSPAAPLD